MNITKLIASAVLVLGLAACAPVETEGSDSPSVESSDKKSNETKGQENARKAAENYLDTAPFSKSGLIKQLKFEKYSEADAKYAVNHVKVNWREEAAEAAKNYLDLSPFSRAELIKQLKFEGYTPQQAAFGADKAGL